MRSALADFRIVPHAMTSSVYYVLRGFIPILMYLIMLVTQIDKCVSSILALLGHARKKKLNNACLLSLATVTPVLNKAGNKFVTFVHQAIFTIQ